MKPHILIAEDNSTHRALTQQILLDMGYDVTAVDNGYTALSKITSDTHKYALVLMDWEMPEMDGLEAVRKIREHQEKDDWPHIPVIAFTGNKTAEDKEQCLAAGMDDYMPKEIFLPKWRPALQHKIGEWLMRKTQAL